MFKSIIAFTKCKKFYGGNNMNDVIRLVKKGFWYTISDFAYSDIRQSTLVDANFIFEMEKMMKEKYKLTIPDKIEKFKDKLDMLNTFIDILN